MIVDVKDQNFIFEISRPSKLSQEEAKLKEVIPKKIRFLFCALLSILRKNEKYFIGYVFFWFCHLAFPSSTNE